MPTCSREFAARVKKFQEFRRELVRRGTEISPAAGREWGNNDANRTVRTALTNDLDVLGQLYAKRSRDIYAPDRRRHRYHCAGDDGCSAHCRADAGDVRRADDPAVDRAAARRRHPRHRGGGRRRRHACRAVIAIATTRSARWRARSRCSRTRCGRNVELNKTVLAEAEARGAAPGADCGRNRRGSAPTSRRACPSSGGCSNRCCRRRRC